MWRPQSKEALIREMRIREWRSKAWQQSVRAVGVALRVAFSALCRAWSWLVGRSSVTAREVEMRALVSKRHDLILRLGEVVYQLHRQGATDSDQIKTLCQAIEDLDRTLDEKESVSRTASESEKTDNP
ncbi:MAG: hypothetical protein NZ959_08830 [Armatimonadetes bacterium]|nr:hypothetical protein [Armatimonadota bacterium]MDW8121473.1 hypothetical protein [Armatimonadota bacterium]